MIHSRGNVSTRQEKETVHETGHVVAQHSIFHGIAAGPSTSSHHIQGAAFTAEGFRLGGGMGPVSAYICPNVNTGISLRDGLEARVLGVGFSVSTGHLGLHLPVGSASCCIQ